MAGACIRRPAGWGSGQLLLTRAGFIGGPWLVIISWFLAMAARSEVVNQQVRGLLHGLMFGDALDTLGSAGPVVVTSTGGTGDEVRGVVTPEQPQRYIARTMQLGSQVGAGQRRTSAHTPDGDG